MIYDLNLVMFYTTVQTHEQAKELAEKLIRSKIVSCVNILPQILSCYNGDEKLIWSEEIPLIIKVPEDRYNFAHEALMQWHPYDIPAILSWTIQANRDYSIWAYQNTK